MQDSAATSCAVRPPLSSPVNLRRTHRGCRSREARERRLHLHRGLSRAFFHDEDYYDEHCSAVSTSDYDHADRFSGHSPNGDIHCGEGARHGFIRFSGRAPNGEDQHDDNSPLGGGHGQSTCPPGVDIHTHFSIFHLNVCGFDVGAHTHLLDTLLSLQDFPEFVAITETHLTPTIEIPKLSRYHLVSRRDRPDHRGWGGVALFARHDVFESIVFIKESDTLELTWHTLHSDIGPLLLDVWYRPPKKGEVTTIKAFDKELEGFQDYVGRIVVGDMNVHNEPWLKHSNGTSPEGTELEAVCTAHGLSQRVKKPTRGIHLLDLVLTDLGKHVKCSVGPGILDNDHFSVLAVADITVPTSEPRSRECFEIAKANWKDLNRAFSTVDWASFFANASPDTAAASLTEKILTTARRFIPTKTTTTRPYEHPWIDDECRRLLAQKHAAVGTDGFAAARDACTVGFSAAQARFLHDTKETLRKASAKDWWKYSKELMSKASGTENIPPLKSSNGWAKKPQEKATLLSQTFSDKAKLPDPVDNEFTPVLRSSEELAGFMRIRVRTVRKILKGLDESSGTGPDLLPAVILRRCAKVLALPIALLSRMCLNFGRWPETWRMHWIHPLHKRKSRADPINYRGVHLTPQIAKVVERAVGSTFVPWMQKHSFGEHQYAYSNGKSHRDVLAVNVCSWLLAFEDGNAVGLYCSDVAGAFDRVCKDRMCEKLRASGLPPSVVAFLESWLEDRVSHVVVSGVQSVEEILANSVFQGTVLGPPLWNAFYADARFSVRRLGFTETVFADDFNCWLILDKGISAEDAVLLLSKGQCNLHAWGYANGVVFDPTKEVFIVMRRREAVGEKFKLLGLTFDSQLLMHAGTRKIATEAGWGLQSILRAAKYFSTPEVFRLYKAYVLSFIESGAPGYYHAAPSVLECIDRVQRRFLRVLGMSEEHALLNFRLAPLVLRRDIGILGFLHRVNLGQVSEQIRQLFPPTGPRRSASSGIAGRVRGATAFHTKQFFDRVTATPSEQFKRSIFGMVQCYNALPQRVVDQKTVSASQGCLQESVKTRAREGFDGWQDIFSVGRRYASVLRFQAFFLE